MVHSKKRQQQHISVQSIKDIDALHTHDCESIVVDITRRVSDGVMSAD